MPSIVKELRGVCTLDDIRTAFEINHPRVHAETSVKSKAWGSIIEIEGRFIDRLNGLPAGAFLRRLEMPGNRIRVQHSYIQIEESHRRCGIAWEHYSAALRFYRSRIRPYMIYMDAVEQGPYVWGDLGFEFTGRIWKQLIARLESLHEAVYGFPLDNYPSTATGLVHLQGVDGFPIGEEAIRAVHSTSGPLRMVLNLYDDAAVQFLECEGILSP